MSEFRTEFVERVLRHWPLDLWRDTTVLAAISGGPDSLALLLVLRTICPVRHLEVAHFHHRWRGTESDQDAEFVASLCRQWQIPFHLGHMPDDLPRTEQMARDQRYAFLGSTAEQRGARYVALGHTRDDQVETILHRIVRGSGLRGITGMPALRPWSDAVTLVRPLLTESRSDVLQFLAACGQDYLTDPSNAQLNYTRNRLRHTVLPQLRAEFNPNVDEALLRLAEQARDAQACLAELVAPLLARCVSSTEVSEVRIELQPLGPPPADYLLRELLITIWQRHDWPQQAMTADHWKRLAAWLVDVDAPPRWDLPGGVTAQRQPDGVCSLRHTPS